ncbi:MAG: hypothetical protein M3P87_02995, partial [Actinomycetota bacterium]|nr:hypothetical protein [Actinomycetota bacterium]
MTERTAAKVAWVAGVLVFALAVAAIIVTFAYPLGEGTTIDVGNAIATILIFVSFPTVGALVASRRPRNPIGWLLMGIGALFVLALALGNYGEYGLRVDPGSLPGAVWAAWVGGWIWPVVLGLVGLPLLLFPNGRAPAPRWVWAGKALVGSIILWVLAAGLVPGPMTNAGFENVDNPFGVVDSLRGLLLIASGLAGLGILFSVLACAMSMVVRFRRSRGIEREQVKWLAYAASLIAMLGVFEIVVEGTNPPELLRRISQLALAGSISALPIAAGIAILRYRIYDIDRLISRTIAYTIVTGLLAAGYAGLVLLLQLALPVSQESSILVAATTLAVVALFGPLRDRVQALVDRRFNRRRYDVQRTLVSFGARLRSEANIDILSSDLVAIVTDTMQPSHVSLWLRRVDAA